MAPTITVDGDEIIDASIDGDAVEEITIDGDLAWAAAVGLDGLTVTRQDGSYTASSGEHVVSNGGTITLPSPVQDGVVMITEVQTTPQLSGSVDGITDPYISGDDSVVFVSEGSAWYSVDRNQISAIPDSVETQYRFEDDSDTTTALDGVGSNNATISGPIYTSNAAKGSRAIEDNGVDRSGNNVESNATVDLVASGDSQALSVGCFARPEGATGFYYPVSHGINGGDNLSVVAGADAGNWEARLVINSTEAYADSGVSVASSTYTAVFAVADQSEVGIIVDGTLEATTTHSLDLTNIGAGSHKAIQGHSSSNNIFDGGVDDATYASDRFTAAEAQQLIGR